MIEKAVRFLRIVIAVSAFAGLTACARKAPTTSTVSIAFPKFESKAQQRSLASALGTSAYDFSLACFAVNITAPDISSQSYACGPTTGVFAGYVPPGGDISLTIPQGTGRTLEIYSYLRGSSTESCPAGAASPSSVNLTQVVRLDSQTFDATSPEVDLTVNLTAPAAGVNLLTQLNLPAVCLPPPPAIATPAEIVAGRGAISGGAYSIVGAVSGQQNEKLLQGGSFQVRLSRRVQ